MTLSGIVVTIAFDAVPMTATLLAPWHATYRYAPSGVTANPVGEAGTLMEALTVWVAVFTTEIEFPEIFDV